jgi:hypothetical protein
VSKKYEPRTHDVSGAILLNCALLDEDELVAYLHLADQFGLDLPAGSNDFARGQDILRAFLYL